MEPRNKAGQSLSPIVENLHAPEIFADEVSSMSVGNGLVALTLTSVRWDNSLRPPQQRRVVVGRFKLPVVSAERFTQELRHFLDVAHMPTATAEEKKRMQ